MRKNKEYKGFQSNHNVSISLIIIIVKQDNISYLIVREIYIYCQFSYQSHKHHIMLLRILLSMSQKCVAPRRLLNHNTIPSDLLASI